MSLSILLRRVLIVTPRFLASSPTDERNKVTGGTFERYGWPIEVARTVAFLASEAAGYITGQVIRCGRRDAVVASVSLGSTDFGNIR